MLLFASALFILLGMCASSSFRQKGPHSWIQRLSPDEIAEINQHCSYDIKQTPQQILRSVEDRIQYGQNVPRGKYPFAVAFMYPEEAKQKDTERTHCTGFLVSRRHVITARHCWQSGNQFRERYEKLRLRWPLMAGGVCYLQDAQYGCHEMDMYELEYDFAIFTHDELEENEADFAIVQLTKPVPEDLRERIGFACLPAPDSITPPELTLMGWGLVELPDRFAKVRTSIHLREVQVLTKPDATAQGLAPLCHDMPYLICSYHLRHEQGPLKTGSWEGDSGGPAGVFETRDGKHAFFTVYGSIVAGKGYQVNNKWYKRSDNLDMRYYYGDFCFYLGLCVHPNKTTPRMRMGSLFLGYSVATAEFKLRSQLPPIEPFRMYNTERDKKLYDGCPRESPYDRKKRQVGPAPIGAQIAAALVDSSGMVACGAIFVTTAHLVTTRTCVQTRLAAAPPGEKVNFSIMAGGVCLKQGALCPAKDMIELKIEFIAWYVDREFTTDVAVIQLVKDIMDDPEVPQEKKLAIHPACFSWATDRTVVYGWGADEVDGHLLQPARLYYGNLTLSKHHAELRCTFPKICLEPMQESGKNPFLMPSTNFGGGILETQRRGFLVSMLVSTVERVNAHITMDVEYIYGIFCTYLNRCPPRFDYKEPKQVNYMLNKIPWFSEIYQINPPA